MAGGRPSGPKTRCSGQWTEARFRSFIKGNLRSATRKWAPIQEVAKEARRGRGLYLCAGCSEIKQKTTIEDGKRVNNCNVDHIDPAVDPAKGWEGYDILIERMFCEKDNLQVLCHACHQVKSNEEKEIAKQRRANDKYDEEE